MEQFSYAKLQLVFDECNGFSYDLQLVIDKCKAFFFVGHDTSVLLAATGPGPRLPESAATTECPGRPAEVVCRLHSLLARRPAPPPPYMRASAGAGRPLCVLPVATKPSRSFQLLGEQELAGSCAKHATSDAVRAVHVEAESS